MVGDQCEIKRRPSQKGAPPHVLPPVQPRSVRGLADPTGEHPRQAPRGLHLAGRPQERGEDHRREADGQTHDLAGHALAHEHRAEDGGETDDAACGQHPHRRPLDFVRRRERAGIIP